MSDAPRSNTPSLSDQTGEVELHCLGLSDLIERAEAKQIKRTPEDISRYRARLAAAQAALATLRDVEARA